MDKNFFNREADVVARDLLGRVIVRNIEGKELRAKIVETEAYFDENDPASRACQNGDLRETMMMGPGTILVYGVHNNWLINFVTGNIGKASAVLIRAIEPLNFEGKGNGPGLLTKSLEIDKIYHKKNVLDNGKIKIESYGDNLFEISKSFRIGVTKDLETPMRFYIKDNKFVSRK
ncbi:MAG TPA: DNA-3-methyladenine glycosylase [Candidatus Pacearchaeota archaeon]|jgi:DNA-3-methyladenine glycosylase|nr:DNA-3-methyladenine glycosylase [Candidatus Pacearchaeota archaeon]